MNFDLTAVGTHFDKQLQSNATTTEKSDIEEELDGIIADAIADDTEQSESKILARSKMARELVDPIVSWRAHGEPAF